MSPLASIEIDKFAFATNRALGTCYARAYALESDHVRLIKVPL